MIALSNRPAPNRYYSIILIMALLLTMGSFYADFIFQQSGQAIQAYIGTFVSTQFSLLFITMLAAWYLGPKSQDLSDYKTLLIIAVIARIILFPIAPYMSNDVDRYLFDGYIASIGLDPYTMSHNDPLLASAISQWAPPVEHAKYATLYPPAGLALFTLAASLGPEFAPIVWKALVLLASVVTLLIGARVLQKLQKLQHLSLIALSPILILESGVGMHLDTFSVLFVASALWALVTDKTQPKNTSSRYIVCAGIFIGMGTLTKLLPIVLLAPLVAGLAKSSVKHALYLVIATLGTVISGYAISYALGLTPIGSIGVFFEKFRFGSPYFYWLEPYLSLPRLAIITALILFVGFSITCLITWSKSKTVLDAKSITAIQVALCLPLFFSPVVYSWYLAPLALLVALSPNLPLLLWLGLMPLTYEVLGKWVCCHDWNPAVWPMSLIAIGLSLSFVYLFFHKQEATPDNSANVLLI